ncbi:ATP-binding protein [Phenylobacterium sp.]|uniref:hybrid sensor histidine kinase/response regulator n=1 Tax=Phenylobacterium sp. TaxID=1871053 RepID=UPI0035AE9ABA
MLNTFDANQRILEWRVNGLKVRLAQGLLVGVMAFLVTRTPVALIWIAVSSLVMVLDARLSAALLARPEHRGLATRTTAVRSLSGSLYAMAGLLFLLHPGSLGLGAALLVGCCLALNNAVMTRGVRGFTASLTLPSALSLLATAPLARSLGHALSLADVAFLIFGAMTYLVFLAKLASLLADESQTLHHALGDLQREHDAARGAQRQALAERARWSSLFDNSPVPQICCDASRLYARLSQGEADVINALLADRLQVDQQGLAGVWIINANDAALDLFGVKDFRRGITAEVFDTSLLTGLALSLRDATPDGVLPPFPTTLRRADGALAEVMAHVRFIEDEAEPWSMCVITLVDITAFQAVVRDQAEAMLAAQAASVAKSEFLAIMSHEIRTPMNGVLGMAQAMSREPLSASQRDKLDVIRQSGEALLAILNDVLDISKIESGRLELEASPFDIEAVAQGAHATFTGLANAKGLSFSLTVTPEALGAYVGDSARVRQVLYNLISNAVKFTAAGHVRVEIEALSPGFRIRVTDTGVGVPADRLDKLFAKFVQADSSTTRQFGGTGLGLAICRELADAMGGSIAVSSVEGEGSCFTVDLPLPRAAGAAPEVEAPAETGQDLGLEFRILAAEDNTINQLVLKTLLAQFGLTPQVVDNGHQAVQAWEKESWDLILMDVQMPVLDGPGAARAIRAREAETGRARTPIIALTANAMTHQVDSYLAAGMDGFVAKPIEVRDLVEAINQAMAGRADDEVRAGAA